MEDYKNLLIKEDLYKQEKIEFENKNTLLEKYISENKSSLDA